MSGLARHMPMIHEDGKRTPAPCGGPGCCPDCAAAHLRSHAPALVVAAGDYISVGDGGDEARGLLRKALRLLPTSDTRDEITAFLGATR